MKKGMYIAVILVFGIIGQAFSQATNGEIIGRVWDIDSNNTVPTAYIHIEIGGARQTVLTDMDGKFRFSSIPSGIYTLTATMSSSKRTIAGISVKPDQITNLGNFTLQDSIMAVVEIIEYVDPLVSEEPAKINISLDDIRVSANRTDPLKLVTTAGGTQLTADGQGVIIRGSRPESTIYYIDGVKQTSMARVPSASIGHISVYTGGLPAKYGDCTGGVVVMETLSYFDLYNRWKSKNR